jgi:C4-dicarboxylate transporter
MMDQSQVFHFRKDSLMELPHLLPTQISIAIMVETSIILTKRIMDKKNYLLKLGSQQNPSKSKEYKATVKIDLLNLKQTIRTIFSMMINLKIRIKIDRIFLQTNHN